MGGVAKDVSVCRVKRGAALPHHFHISKPGLEGGLHVLMAPFLDGGPFPPACITATVFEACIYCKPCMPAALGFCKLIAADRYRP